MSRYTGCLRFERDGEIVYEVDAVLETRISFEKFEFTLSVPQNEVQKARDLIEQRVSYEFDFDEDETV